jgi:hypothetical protein
MRALLHRASPTVCWAGGGYVSEFWLDL